jgi:DNA-binding transcriptional MerR regulator
LLDPDVGSWFITLTREDEKMEYTIGALAELAGVSRRTLRYYDQIGLLSPASVNSSGYRIYGEREVDLLQQILFFRAIDMPLDQIRTIVTDPDFDPVSVLESHRERLIEARVRMDDLISSIDRSLSHHKGEITMTDDQKFEALKRQKLEENEQRFGDEIRKQYGEVSVRKSNRQFMNLSSTDMAQMEETEKQMIELLIRACETGDRSKSLTSEIYRLHRSWLSYTWESYNADAHKNLARMYADDPRFASYYNDKAGVEITPILCESIIAHAR